MSYVLMISEARLKKITSIDDNVEPDDLVPFITQAQDLKIQSILGTYFYNNLKDDIANASVSDDDRTLLNDYIAPLLANYALYLALPSLNFKVKNKAVLNPTSEESNSTGLDELKYLRQSVKDTAEFYEQRLLDYLCDFSTLFPDYVNPDGNGMNPQHNKRSTSGIYTPNTAPSRHSNGYDYPSSL